MQAILRLLVIWIRINVLLFIAPCSLFAQVDSTAHSQHLRFTFHQLMVPVWTAGTGTLISSSSPEAFKTEVVEFRDKQLKHFKTSADNYLQISPLIVAYGLDAAGIP